MAAYSLMDRERAETEKMNSERDSGLVGLQMRDWRMDSFTDASISSLPVLDTRQTSREMEPACPNS